MGGNRIRGEWHNHSPPGWITDHFCWFSDTAGDVMYGYTGAYDPAGGAVFRGLGSGEEGRTIGRGHQ